MSRPPLRNTDHAFVIAASQFSIDFLGWPVYLGDIGSGLARPISKRKPSMAKSPKNTEATASDFEEDGGEVTEAVAGAKGKRAAVTKRTWLGQDGSPVTDAREAGGVQIDVLGDGGGQIKAFVADFSDGVRKALASFGLNIVLTNTMGGLKGADAMDAMAARLETLEAGEWSSRKGGGGPQISMLAAAIHEVLTSEGKAGALTVEAVGQRLKDGGEDFRKKQADNAKVKAVYDRLRAEAAAKRAAESGKRAETADTGSLADDFA